MKRLMFKAIKTITLSASLFAFSFTANATEIRTENPLQGNPNISVMVNSEAKALDVRLQHINREGYTLKLKDEQGNILAQETVKNQPSYAKRYRLNALQAGIYELTIQKSLETVVQKVALTTEGVQLLESKKIFTPVLYKKAKVLDINALQTKQGDMTVTIFSNEGRKMFSETHPNAVTLNKRYNLDKLPSGVYIVEIVTQDETHYDTIEL